jgi:hypothetical protein
MVPQRVQKACAVMYTALCQILQGYLGRWKSRQETRCYHGMFESILYMFVFRTWVSEMACHQPGILYRRFQHTHLGQAIDPMDGLGKRDIARLLQKLQTVLN